MLKKLVFVAASLAAPAAAQDSEFARFVERTNAEVPPPSAAELDSAALDILRQVAAAKQGCVPTGIAMEPPRSTAAARFAADLIQAGQIRNAWTAYGRPQGCPARGQTRFLALRMTDGSLLVRVVNVGETLANPSLMRDTSYAVAVAAVEAIRKARPDCTDTKDIDMAGTRVISRSRDLSPDWNGARYAGSWTEGWSFTVCGRRAEVPITFTADGQGGANWTVAAEKAKLVD